MTTFLSQQTGQQTPFVRANVTAESQYRAIYTANAMRTESPVPTYIYTIGLGISVISDNASFPGTTGKRPSLSNLHFKPTSRRVFLHTELSLAELYR